MRISLTCADCQTQYAHDAQGGRRPERCPPCRAERARIKRAEISRRYRARDPERAREQSRRHHVKRKDLPEFRQYKRDNELRRLYGLTPEQLQAMRDAQGDRCAICKGDACGAGDRLHIDHDHITGKVRGLLCSRCNTMLGLAGDDLDRLRAAAAYIRKHRRESDG